MKTLIIFLLLVSFCQPSPSTPLIGFCWVSPPLSDSLLLEEGFQMAHHLGCQIEHRQFNWNEIEKEKGVYDWNSMDFWYTTCLKYDISPSAALCAVNSNSAEKNFPKDLVSRVFDDGEVISRLQEFTRILLERYPDIKYLSFGNEINYYFRTHWNDVPSYANMCLQMYQFMRAFYPDVYVLVIFGFTGMEKREEEMIPAFYDACDIVGISTYHASVSMQLIPPHLTDEEMRQGFEYCIRLCNGKRVAIVETSAFSYPDPQYQARFVHAFFDIIREYSEEMEFACWLGTFDSYPGTFTMVMPFLEQFNSAGLLESDGIQKPSYDAWMEEMSQLGYVKSQYQYSPAAIVLIIIILLLKVKS